MQILQTSQGYIFRVLPNFGSKLCNSANRRILFLAVVTEDFVFFLPRSNVSQVYYANCPLKGIGSFTIRDDNVKIDVFSEGAYLGSLFFRQ